MHVHLPAYVLICGPNSLRFCASVVEPSSPVTAAPRRAALAFILITVTLDMLALGVIVPVLPRLVVDFAGGDTARGAEIYGLFGTVWALMQFFFSPILGSISDRFGRRPVILLSNLGLGLDYIFMALAPTISWLFVGRVISGITSASLSTAYAYIADVTPQEKRAAGFGMVVGPALGGLLGGVDPRLPFWVAAGLSLANACYGWLVLPESLPRERRMGFSWRRANPLGSLVLLRSHPELFGLAVVNFLSNLAHAALPSTFVLYAGYRYGWDAQTVGIMLASVGIASVIVQGGVIGPVVKRIGERAALLVGLVCGVAGFAVYGVAPTGTLFLVGVPIVALWGLAGAAAQGLMTRRVGVSEQGQLQGANGSVRGITELIGPGLFTQSFAFFIAAGTPLHLPGAPFLLASLLLAAALLVAWRVTRPGPA
jgi:DHA1 family tetracycline resistance protein-like MFS transporter